MPTGTNMWKSKSELQCFADMCEIRVGRKPVASPLCQQYLVLYYWIESSPVLSKKKPRNNII